MFFRNHFYPLFIFTTSNLLNSFSIRVLTLLAIADGSWVIISFAFSIGKNEIVTLLRDFLFVLKEPKDPWIATGTIGKYDWVAILKAPEVNSPNSFVFILWASGNTTPYVLFFLTNSAKSFKTLKLFLKSLGSMLYESNNFRAFFKNPFSRSFLATKVGIFCSMFSWCSFFSNATIIAKTSVYDLWLGVKSTEPFFGKLSIPFIVISMLYSFKTFLDNLKIFLYLSKSGTNSGVLIYFFAILLTELSLNNHKSPEKAIFSLIIFDISSPYHLHILQRMQLINYVHD
ncbi:Hypothetical protein MCYN_0392 [Mycoplasmopsis cynos C142]|uniref:Uncharacterized protein n=1 Tax=Mycoplasmopsis cynos (strain C142) TaxID=1246955 RepID=L0RUM9_MYCC1|nr:Hypothetical protein MCYN_0392 [Mycoplasmopsis cynos C142]